MTVSEMFALWCLIIGSFGYLHGKITNKDSDIYLGAFLLIFGTVLWALLMSSKL